jgi:NAD(P)-dependent dehydrogenase (short-subunit alcohol dehydrogenase family)
MNLSNGAMNINERFAGKSVVVTGGASGIGLAMATRFAAEGAAVVVADISGAEEQVAAEIGGIAFHGDVSDPDDAQAMIALAQERQGGLHAFCANAGIDGDWSSLVDCPTDNFDRVVAVNFRGVFLGMRSAVPALHASGGGSIVATASAAGVVAAPQLAAYGAAKSAVIGLTRTAAVECASLGVRVNCICPGVVNTPITRRAPKEIYDAFVRAHPIGRLAEPEEIAAAALFLASDDASFVTGAALCVDGGFTVA